MSRNMLYGGGSYEPSPLPPQPDVPSRRYPGKVVYRYGTYQGNWWKHFLMAQRDPVFIGKTLPKQP